MLLHFLFHLLVKEAGHALLHFVNKLRIELIVVYTFCIDHPIGFDNQETATAAAVVKQFTGIACTDKRGDSRQTVEVLFICPDKTWFHGLH